jgi:hypothetical protein
MLTVPTSAAVATLAAVLDNEEDEAKREVIQKMVDDLEEEDRQKSVMEILTEPIRIND